MDKGWLELESDPGLFTLLVEDFDCLGVQGVQVEEIYDLQKSFDGQVYGFIFLFRWIEERRSRRSKVTQEEDSFVMDDKIINSMFFAHQMIPNSCATHALLSVLLNCETKVKLGDMLTKLKHFTSSMTPEVKGLAIGNMPDLAKAHNSHARPEPCRLPEKQQGVSACRTQEAFHYVSYVPINGHLFELDGLRPYPIDHGEAGDDWTEMFRRVITERLGMATGGEPYHDIRFNLMAVVPDKRLQCEQKLKTLKTNRQIVLDALQQLLDSKIVKVMTEDEKMPKNVKLKPIVTRSVAAREAATANHGESSSKQTSKGRRSSNSSSNDNKPLVSDFEQQMSSCAGLISHDDDSASNSINMDKIGTKQLETVEDGCVKIHISVNDGRTDLLSDLSATDITKPLVIETEFGSMSPCSSSGSSTDTASEVASLLNSPAPSSPGSMLGSPNSANPSVDYKPPNVDDVERNLDSKLCFESQNDELMMDVDIKTEEGEKYEGICNEKSKMWLEKKNGKSSRQQFSGQVFTPKDLLDLLNNVNNEIASCESTLRDEVEKRKKYKIDDCRRTHNYDEFIRTFLTMLAEQGQLAGLVEQHVLTKRRQGVSIGRLHEFSKTEKKKRGKRKR